MFKKIISFICLTFTAYTGSLSATVNYEIHDIDILQTHSSEAIAINNRGQILGWYNVDGTAQGKQFFVREREGAFYELPESVSGLNVEWKYLIDNGNAYGEHKTGANTTLFTWDARNGEVNLGVMPGKKIATINNLGQVLIEAVSEQIDGKSVCCPVIWHNGKITKLRGLSGDLGIESTESYGYDMNNRGEVVGQSLTSLVYKNNVYYQTHAVKWTNGKVIDLHKTIPKSERSSALLINDLGVVAIGQQSFLVDVKGQIIGCFKTVSKTGKNYFYNDRSIGSSEFINTSSVLSTSLGHINEMKTVSNINQIDHAVSADHDSIWLRAKKIIGINDNGEIIAEGETIYGEKHAILLTPIKTQ